MDEACHDSCRGRPIDVLKREHRVIERGLDALEQMMAEDRIDVGFMRTALDFFRSFADSCHHAKEEDQLFPVLESAGLPREGGPIGCMLHEHMIGRALVQRMGGGLDSFVGGDAAAESEIRQAAAQYISMLRQHIMKEDNVLFAIADRLVDPQGQAELGQAFDRVEQSPQHNGRHERYVAVVEHMRERAFGKSAGVGQGA